MKTYRDIQITAQDLISVTCDKCGKIDTIIADYMDLYEWQHIHFTGGYGSVFEDGGEYECDLCQECTKELLGNYLRYLGNRI